MENNIYIEIAPGWSVDINEEKIRTFSLTTHVVTMLFDRLLDYKSRDFQKIRIELFPEAQKTKVYPPEGISPVVHIERSFDFDHYFRLTKKKRRAYLLEILYETLQTMCSELNYNLQPFYKAYEQVKALNYQNEYVHGKLKTAPDRTHKVGVHIRVDEEYAVISALVQDSEGNETARIEILRTLPHYMFIYKFIYQTKWLDKEHFQISDKSGQVVFEVNVSEEKARMQLLPKTMELPELVKEVAMAVADETDMP